MNAAVLLHTHKEDGGGLFHSVTVSLLDDITPAGREAFLKSFDRVPGSATEILDVFTCRVLEADLRPDVGRFLTQLASAAFTKGNVLGHNEAVMER